MTEIQTNTNHILESSKTRELCDQCKTKEINDMFYLTTTNPFHYIKSSTYYFCCADCQNEFENEKMCKFCHYDYYPNDNKKFMECHDGAWFCVNNDMCVWAYSKFAVNIDCYQQYTGNYTCYYCENEKNVYEDACYIVREDCDKNFVCSQCIDSCGVFIEHSKNRREYTEMNGWRDVYSRLNDRLIKALKKNPRFICNKCNKISNITDGIHIVNNVNVCNLCFET